MNATATTNRILFIGHSSSSGYISHTSLRELSILTAAMRIAAAAGRSRDMIHCYDAAIEMARQAHLSRQYDEVKRVGDLLQSNAMPQGYEQTVNYIQGLSISRKGKGSIEETNAVFAKAADDAPPAYRARAIMALAANACCAGNFKEGLYLLLESLRGARSVACSDPVVIFQSLQLLCFLRSVDGNYKAALETLTMMQALLPAIAAKYPQLHFEYLNALADVQSRIGDHSAALQVIRRALSSSATIYMPELFETYNEILDRMNPSSESILLDPGQLVLRHPENVIYLPQRGESARMPAFKKPGTVLSYDGWGSSRPPTTKEPSTPSEAELKLGNDKSKLICKIIDKPQELIDKLTDLVDAWERDHAQPLDQGL